MITPHDPPAIPTNPQWWCKPELHCVYHSGAPGHDVENCPNMKKNPLPEHGKSAVNMVQGCPGKYKVRYVSHIRQSLVKMHRLLCGYSHYEHDHDNCRICTVYERGYRQVRKDIQEMLDQGVIEILQNCDEDKVNVISPVFRFPEPVVPYRYNAVALEDGKEVPLPSTSITSISDVSGLIRGGRVFSVPPKPQVDTRRADAAVNSVARPVGNSSSSPNPALAVDRPVVTARAPVPAGQNGMLREDCDEMLRLIIGANIMFFCDADLPEEGKDHNLALHISMNCKDDALSNVLGPPMRQSGVVVKAFDGSRKTVIGEVELPIKIGPSDFQITFQGGEGSLGKPFYIDAEDEVGTPFQALSIVEPSKKGTSSFASYNDAELAIEHGATTGLGQMIKLEDNKSRAGIGLIKPIEHNDPTPSPNFEFPVFEAEEGDVEEIPDEITRLLEHKEKIIQPHLENLETVNLGSEDCVREVKIGALLEESVKKGLIELLREYVDVFSWSYEDMPGLDTDIVQHFLPLKPECVPMKQKFRRTHPDMAVKIKEEFQKQIDAGFLVTSTYPQWVANIVPVPKKDGKVRMCMDYRDLNKASPKDDFPLPHIDMLVDNTAKFNVFSFMDGFSGYNQIKMARGYGEDNIHHTLRNILLPSDAIRFEERRSHVSTSFDYLIS
ncbi:hypothetical protein KIW84_057300 [Lathyrus oleraceus]|uniref:Reverse transcriptase domain-containing protein n=1 Tax=Pisum sativum TaxID=3888 RepID=A0A9D5AMC6_PEA|nr:hypothetical protein KIW84_057300 [Pisum sativum]